jgi:hypothetical protein
VAIDGPREVLARAAAALAGVAADLEAYVPTPHPPRYPGGATPPRVTDIFPFDPIVGPLNPLAPRSASSGGIRSRSAWCASPSRTRDHPGACTAA